MSDFFKNREHSRNVAFFSSRKLKLTPKLIIIKKVKQKTIKPSNCNNVIFNIYWKTLELISACL